MNPLDIMTKGEATRRALNPLQYKFNALIENYSDSEEKHKGNGDIINDHKKKLAWLQAVAERIDEEFKEEFQDEPSDQDFKNFIFQEVRKLDEDTYNYRKTEIERAEQDHNNEYKHTIVIKGSANNSKHLSITEKELHQIKAVLLGD